MADITIDPISTDPLAIQLYGNSYKLKEPVQVVMSSQYPQKMVIGDYTADDNPFVSIYNVTDLRQGPGLWTYRNPKEDLTKYWQSVPLSGSVAGIATTIWANAICGEVTSRTLYDTPNTSSSTAIPQWIFTVGTYTVYVTAGNQVYSSTGAAADTLPAAVVAPPTVFRFYDSSAAAYKTRVFYATTTGYSYQDDVTAAATDISSSAADPGMIASVVWDGKIWALDGNRRSE